MGKWSKFGESDINQPETTMHSALHTAPLIPSPTRGRYPTGWAKLVRLLLTCLLALFFSSLCSATPFSYTVGISSDLALLPNSVVEVRGIVTNTGTTQLAGIPVGTGLAGMPGVLVTHSPGPNDISHTIGPTSDDIHSQFNWPTIDPGTSFDFIWSVVTVPDVPVSHIWGSEYLGYLLFVPSDGSTHWLVNPLNIVVKSVWQDGTGSSEASFNYVEVNSDAYQSYLSVTTVPEPSSLVLFCVSIIGAGILRRCVTS